MKLKRFGVSMEESLLGEFDRLIESRGYKNRSEAIRDLVRKEMVEEKWESASEDCIGIVSLVYNHHQRELDSKLNEIQHEKHSNVLSSLHIHLDYHNCLEVILIKGSNRDIKGLADSLIGARGVKHGTLSITNSNPE